MGHPAHELYCLPATLTQVVADLTPENARVLWASKTLEVRCGRSSCLFRCNLCVAQLPIWCPAGVRWASQDARSAGWLDFLQSTALRCSWSCLNGRCGRGPAAVAAQPHACHSPPYDLPFHTFASRCRQSAPKRSAGTAPSSPASLVHSTFNFALHFPARLCSPSAPKRSAGTAPSMLRDRCRRTGCRWV